MKALIIADMINDFVTGSLKCDRGSKIIPNIKKLADFCRSRGIPVIYVNDQHLKGDKEFDLWVEHAMAGTRGGEVIPELGAKEGDYVLSKRRYSGFFATGLDLLLRELGVDEIIITGLLTNLCVLHTAADAYFRSYKIAIPEDGVEALTQEDQESALSYMEKFYGVKVLKTEELMVNR
jgi:nicotinamidase-related amidase